MLLGGTLSDVHATVNFGSRVEESFRKYREYRAEEPLMVMEFWNGWFDHWMEDHHVRDAADVAGVLDEMLEMGSSMNMYMFHGEPISAFTVERITSRPMSLRRQATTMMPL